MNKIKKILCLCTAFLLMASSVSCNNKKNSSPDKSGAPSSSDTNRTENISKNIITEYFDAQEFTFNGKVDKTSITDMKYINDKIYFTASASDDNFEYSLKNINMNDMSSQDINAQSRLYTGQATYISDEKIYSIVSDTESGGQKICVGDAQTGTVEHELKWDMDSPLTSIRTDKDGNIYVLSYQYAAIYKKDLTKPEIIDIFKLLKDTEASNTYTYNFEVSPDGEIYLGLFNKGNCELHICKLNSSHTIEYISDDFSDMQENISGLYFSDNGNLFVCSGLYSTYINEISAATGETVCRYELEGAESFYGICNSRLIYSNGEGIYAYDFDNDSYEQIISFDDPSVQLINTVIDGNNLKTALKINADMERSLYISDTNGNIEKEIPIKGTYEYGSDIFYSITPDGKIYYLKTYYGMKSENGYTHETTAYSVYAINSDNQCEMLFELPESDSDEWCYGFFQNSNGDFCICKPDENMNYLVYCYDISGNLVSSTPMSDKEGLYLSRIVPYKNKILFLYYDDNKMYGVPFNTGDMQFEKLIEFDFNNSHSISQGNNGYDLYYSDGMFIYGYKIETGKSEEIIEFVNTDFPVSPESYLVINTETIISSGYDYTFSDKDTFDRGPSIYKFSKADEERLKQINSKKIITLAGTRITNSETGYMIKNFNRTNDEYRIFAKDYEKYSVYSEDGAYLSGNQQLNADIISGDIPDIVMFDSSSDTAPYLVKGMFADLGKFIDEDKEIKRDDYMSNIFDAYTYKGCLYQIVPSFHCSSIVAKASLAGDKPGWTYEEFFDFINSRPDIQAFDGFNTKGYFDAELITAYINDYVDFDKNTCDFDNENFINLLELINNLINDKEDYEYTEKLLRNNDMLMSLQQFNTPFEYHQYEAGLAGESITFKGFPSESGPKNTILSDTGFCISEKSDNKDGSWQFIRQFLLDSYQDNISMTDYYIPIKKSSVQKRFYGDLSYQDNPFLEGSTIWVNNEEIEIGPITEEAKQKFTDFLQSPVIPISYGSKIMQIVKEETSLYYNGESTAQEAAASIQSKVKLYLNELN